MENGGKKALKNKSKQGNVFTNSIHTYKKYTIQAASCNTRHEWSITQPTSSSEWQGCDLMRKSFPRVYVVKGGGYDDR